MRTPGKMELAAAAWAMAVFLLSTSQARAFFHSGPDLEQGRAIYTANCASCHGANLEGQPNWRTGNEDGTYPAPPHDENGHTWHHGDTVLFDYIKRGGQAALDDMGVDFPSGMPGFGDRLTDEEINVVLDYIKSTWPEDIRAQQEERSTLDAGEP